MVLEKMNEIRPRIVLTIQYFARLFPCSWDSDAFAKTGSFLKVILESHISVKGSWKWVKANTTRLPVTCSDVLPGVDGKELAQSPVVARGPHVLILL